MIKTGTTTNDNLVGSFNADTMSGLAGNDLLFAGSGDDVLEGGTGNDYLAGEDGSDVLDGGGGYDTLYGGEGNDSYVIRDRNTVVYDSSGTDSGTILVDFYKTDPTVENWTWANGVQKLPYWIDALLPGEAPGYLPLLGSAKVYYYSFPAFAPSHFSLQDSFGFLPFNAQQKAFIRQALSYVSTVIDVQFIETTDTSALNNIAFANNTQSGSSGYAYFPYESARGSDVLLDDSARNLAPKNGDFSALTFIHELGHALGLKHSFGHSDADGDTSEAPYLSSAEESTQWTMMSYTDRRVDYQLQYSPFDIAALQYLYGPSAARKTDDIYQLRADTTNFIWDGGGTDTIDGSSLEQAITLYLDAGYWGYVGTKSSLISAAGQITTNFGTAIENAKGGSANDLITGTSAANQLFGLAGDDILSGAGGNDSLNGGAGNDVIDGGTGIDTALLAGARGNFTVVRGAAGISLIDNTGAQGADTLINVERAMFTDTALAFDTDGTAGQVYRLYQAAFDRKPDLGGFGGWIAAIESGLSFSDVASGFVNSLEFKNLYGVTPSYPDLVTRYYQNVLHRQPDQGGFDGWMNVLTTGQATPAQVLVGFSESPENQANLIGVIQNGMEYTPYTA